MGIKKDIPIRRQGILQKRERRLHFFHRVQTIGKVRGADLAFVAASQAASTLHLLVAVNEATAAMATFSDFERAQAPAPVANQGLWRTRAQRAAEIAGITGVCLALALFGADAPLATFGFGAYFLTLAATLTLISGPKAHDLVLGALLATGLVLNATGQAPAGPLTPHLAAVALYTVVAKSREAAGGDAALRTLIFCGAILSVVFFIAHIAALRAATPGADVPPPGALDTPAAAGMPFGLLFALSVCRLCRIAADPKSGPVARWRLISETMKRSLTASVLALFAGGCLLASGDAPTIALSGAAAASICALQIQRARPKRSGTAPQAPTVARAGILGLAGALTAVGMVAIGFIDIGFRPTPDQIKAWRAAPLIGNGLGSYAPTMAGLIGFEDPFRSPDPTPGVVVWLVEAGLLGVIGALLGALGLARGYWRRLNARRSLDSGAALGLATLWIWGGGIMLNADAATPASLWLVATLLGLSTRKSGAHSRN